MTQGSDNASDEVLLIDAPFRAVASFLGGLVAAIGLMVIVGWAIESVPMKAIIPGLVEMKFNTALALLFSGLALMCSSGRRSGKRVLFALPVLLIGTLTSAEYLFRWDAGIDQLFFVEKPGA